MSRVGQPGPAVVRRGRAGGMMHGGLEFGTWLLETGDGGWLEAIAALAATGDTEGARRQLTRAHRAFAAERDVPGIAALTPRETEVVTLLADGLTNREIAARLFVAPGTVSIHVGRAYAKLGVSRRAAAAARLAEAGLVRAGAR
ncbi:helix-turn-helix transcriptional regulator [Paractinoplanes ovalisporus]|uniref:helix-turn-helix transcriptional regulator n=1 Tax=Paractinoplanes ovalisporus TaxID=2810368 RepID=UPI0027DE3297|nr:LuxR C-terminal-related transcriptional regulator [Actinoplanes ovalisporus]